MRIARENQLRQAGIEAGRQADPDDRYAGYFAANAAGLKKESERLEFAGGFGHGKAERLIADVKQQKRGTP